MDFRIVVDTREKSPDAIHDPVEHPSHYTFGRIEVIDAIEAWQLGFHLANVVKYVVRSAHKGNYLQDLCKARWYLDREIQRFQEHETDSPAQLREASP